MHAATEGSSLSSGSAPRCSDHRTLLCTVLAVLFTRPRTDVLAVSTAWLLMSEPRSSVCCVFVHMLSSLGYVPRSGSASSNGTCIHSSEDQQPVTPSGPAVAAPTAAAAQENSHGSMASPGTSFHPNSARCGGSLGCSCVSWEAHDADHLFSCIYWSLRYILCGKVSIQGLSYLCCC